MNCLYGVQYINIIFIWGALYSLSIMLEKALPLPKLLLDLMNQGRWKHPGANKLKEVVPFITEPLIFLENRSEMERASGILMSEHEDENIFFSEYRGSKIETRDLPWIDVEKSIFIICNAYPGDDTGIALDYRYDLNHPRVIGSDWNSGKNCIYREISSNFKSFVKLLEIA